MENKVAKRLADAREKLRFSRRELGEAIGSNETQIWRYETGKNEPTAEMLFKLSRALKVPADWLIGLTDGFEVISPTETRIITENWLFTLHTDRVRLDSIESRIMELIITQDVEAKKRILTMVEIMAAQGQTKAES